MAATPATITVDVSTHPDVQRLAAAVQAVRDLAGQLDQDALNDGSRYAALIGRRFVAAIDEALEAS